MQKGTWIIPILTLLILIPLVNAQVNCNPNQISTTYNQGTFPPQQSTICVNEGNESVTISKTGNYFTISETTIGQAPSQKTININFDSNAPIGFHFGSIVFSDNSPTIPIFMNVMEQQNNPSDIIVFPTNQIVSVQQGDEKTKNIIISVPSDYPESITIQSVNFNPDVETIRFGDLSIGQIPPGGNSQIPIVFSGIDAQTGTYQTLLTILATNSTGQIPLPDVNLQLQITAGINPGNGSLTRPSCSLSAVIMNLNETHKLTCSGVSNNIMVSPLYNEYIEGLGVELTSGIYTYTFKPVKFGTIDFLANFLYQNAPIFEPFLQEISILSTGGGLGGTQLKFSFLPPLDKIKDGDTTIIQIIDNQTDSLILDSKLLVDGVEVTKNGLSFSYNFDLGKNYTLRAIANGYNDLVEDIRVGTQEIEIKLNPTNGDVFTDFNITTNVDASLFINGDKVDNPFFGTLTAGENEIRAIKEGFNDGLLNITIVDNLRVTLSGIFEKNTNQIWKLNKNATWELWFQQGDDPEEILIEGEGNRIEFVPKKKGFYYVKDSEGNTIGSKYEIEGFDFGGWFSWVVIGLIVLVIIIFALRRPSEPESIEAGYKIGGPTGIGNEQISE